MNVIKMEKVVLRNVNVLIVKINQYMQIKKEMIEKQKRFFKRKRNDVLQEQHQRVVIVKIKLFILICHIKMISYIHQ